jgi:shikimate 5-dehydrogenase
MNGGRLVFLGVSTSGSSVPRVMPRWSKALDLDIDLECVDLPVGADRSTYVDLLRRIRSDPHALGTVVTTHKAALWETCADQFDEVSPACRQVREASAIACRNGRLIADASDVRGVGRAVTRILADKRWNTGDHEAIILGAGGAGISLAFNLVDRLPSLGARRVTLTDADPARLAVARSLSRDWAHRDQLEITDAAGGANDRLVAAAKPGTLIVNATGMGKDRPGSPIGVDLPQQTILWEFNYRGPRELLERARVRAPADDLLVIDGRDYFICSWLEALCSVLGRPATDELFEAFDGAATAAEI